MCRGLAVPYEYYIYPKITTRTLKKQKKKMDKKRKKLWGCNECVYLFLMCLNAALTQWRTLSVQPSGCQQWRAASEVGRVWGHGPEVQGPHCAPFWSSLPSLQPAHLSLVCVAFRASLCSPRGPLLWLRPASHPKVKTLSSGGCFWIIFAVSFFFLCLSDLLHLIYTVFKLKHKVFFFSPQTDGY